MIREKTSGTVFGIDISPGMIKLAQETQTSENHKEITFMVGDCSASM